MDSDPLGLCGKSCGLKKGPEYNVSGSIPQNTPFSWHAEFLNDAEHDPQCCEVRQLLNWNKPPVAGQSAPHSGFAPPRDQPGEWYEVG